MPTKTKIKQVTFHINGRPSKESIKKFSDVVLEIDEKSQLNKGVQAVK